MSSLQLLEININTIEVGWVSGWVWLSLGPGGSLVLDRVWRIVACRVAPVAAEVELGPVAELPGCKAWHACMGALLPGCSRPTASHPKPL